LGVREFVSEVVGGRYALTAIRFRCQSVALSFPIDPVSIFQTYPRVSCGIACCFWPLYYGPISIRPGFAVVFFLGRQVPFSWWTADSGWR
jgi:hypothetical protein